MFQLQENKGDGKDKTVFRLWDVTPFDTSVLDGDLHASFPTALLGSDATSTATCTVQLDNIGYLQGISSWAFGGFPAPVNSWICGDDNSDKTMCQATGLQNPLKGFSSIQTVANDLYTKSTIYVTDGGLTVNMPIWSFLSPARQGACVRACPGRTTNV